MLLETSPLRQIMETNKHLIQALERLLRPLVRSLINNGITLPLLSRMLKSVYVKAAQDFSLQHKNLTDSRISLLTGVHRKDVKTIRETQAQGILKRGNYSVAARVLAEWTANSAFLDADGAPVFLPKLGAGSFEELVALVNTDIRARTLLDDWLSKGMVIINEQGLLCLQQAAFAPSHNEKELMDFFGANLADHIAVAAHNLENQADRLLERSTYYDGLSTESVAKIRHFTEQQAMQTLVKVNKFAYQLAKQDAGQPNADQRFNFGTYFYHSGIDPVTSAGPDQPEDATKAKNGAAK